MRKRTRVALIVGVLILSMSLMAISARAVTTPVCNSALNFCGLGTDSGEYGLTANVVINGQTQTMPDGVYAWDADLGGVIIDDMTFEFPRATRNARLTLRIEDLDGYLPFLPHRNTENAYYVNAVLHLYGTDADGAYTDIYTQLGDINLFDSVGNVTGSDFSPRANPVFDYDRITAVELEFSLTATFGSTVTFDHVDLFMFTIYQGIPVEFSENWGQNMEHEFIPYVDEWFSISGGTYEEGYYTGYEVGYNTGFDVGNDHGYEVGYDDGLYVGQNSIPEEVIEANWTGFIYNAANGFLRFELLPGLPLWGLLMAVVAIPLLIAFLKMFMGG